MIMELKKRKCRLVHGHLLVLPGVNVVVSMTLFRCSLSNLMHDDELCCAILLGGPEVPASCR